MKDVVKFPNQHLIEQEAADWLVRLDGGSEPSEIELGELREWLGRSPVHGKELRSLARLWGNMNVLTELAVPLGITGASQKPSRHASWGGSGIRIAAALLAVALFASLLTIFVDPVTNNPFAEDNGFYSTSIGQQQTLVLVDGSSIVLNTNTEISVNYSAQYRDIRLLTGEAHFTATKDAARPFRVYALNKRVEAVGTAFAVHLHENDVQVSVNEGKVALTSQNRVADDPASGNSARFDEMLGTLEAGQEAIIADVDDLDVGLRHPIMKIEDADVERKLSWRKGFLVFSGEPLEMVVDEISRYTTVRIEMSDPAVKSIRIGGQLPVGETNAMLDALESNFGLHVERLSDDRVLLSAASN